VSAEIIKICCEFGEAAPQMWFAFMKFYDGE